MGFDFQQSIAFASYLPATVRHNMAGWFVEFYAFNPIAQKRVRVKYRLNKYRKKFRTMTEFRVWTSQLCHSINAKLAIGWSPFGDVQQLFVMPQPMTIHQTISQQPLQGVSVVPIGVPVVPMQMQVQQSQPITEKKKSRTDDFLVKVIDLFINEKQKELRENTMRSYKSFCNNLKDWVKKNYPKIKASEFEQEQAVEYMEFVFNGNNSKGSAYAKRHDDGTLSARSFNNNVKQGRALFSWAVGKCYCKENPFQNIKTKREEEKQRKLVPQEVRSKITDYFKQNNPAMLLVCEMAFTSLLRPVEISRVQVKHVDLANGCINLPGSLTKNHKNRVCRVSPDMIDLFAKHIQGAKPDDYLFADGEWRCGRYPMRSHSYSNAWARMRKALGLPKEMQLYSLRDTSINGMLKYGVDALSVMQAADHSDLSMTTRYANHADPDLFKKLNELAPSF